MTAAEVERARAYCHSCPVMAECLEAALNRQESFGVWGGFTSAERKRALLALGSPRSVLAHWAQGDLEELVVRL